MAAGRRHSIGALLSTSEQAIARNLAETSTKALPNSTRLPRPLSGPRNDNILALCLLGLVSLSCFATNCETSLVDALQPDEIRYEAFGDPTKPVVVLVHGVGGNADSWSPVTHTLAKTHYVLVPETRGHGGTPARGSDYRPTQMAADLRQFLDHLKIEKADLIGHSMGGRTIIQFAADYPDRTRRVVVEDMHMKSNRKIGAPLGPVADALRALHRSYESEDSARHALHMHQQALDFFWRDWWWEGKLQHNKDRGGSVITNVGALQAADRRAAQLLHYGQGLMEDMTTELARVQAPLLFIAGDPRNGGGGWNAAVLYGVGVDHIRETRPDARIEVVRGAYHGIHHGNTDSFLRLVENFLENRS